MCQIIAFTNLKKIKILEKVNEIGNVLLSEEHHGFGYAVQAKKGMFGEKTIADHFRSRIGKNNAVKLPIIKVKNSTFGEPSELTGPGIFHGRTSTNLISLLNTHPMQIDGWNLIHNGVVEDFGPDYEKQTQNDSEDVLRRLIDGVGKENPMEDIEAFLYGYYAFAAIDPSGRLHIGRDQHAKLRIAWSAKLETYIIGTEESTILKVSKILSAKLGPIDEIDDKHYFIFDGNNLVYQGAFEPAGYTRAQSKYSRTSLGFDLGDDEGSQGFRVHGMQPPIRTATQTSFDDNERATVTRFVLAMEDKVNDVEVGDGGIMDESHWQRIGGDFVQRSENTDDDDYSSRTFDDMLAEHNEMMRGVSEDEYRKYIAEIDMMDASYRIFLPDDKEINHYDFRKMDFASQTMCTVLRADGTLVTPWDYDTPRLPHPHSNKKRVQNDD